MVPNMSVFCSASGCCAVGMSLLSTSRTSSLRGVFMTLAVVIPGAHPCLEQCVWQTACRPRIHSSSWVWDRAKYVDTSIHWSPPPCLSASVPVSPPPWNPLLPPGIYRGLFSSMEPRTQWSRGLAFALTI